MHPYYKNSEFQVKITPKILVVDDQPVNAKLLENALESYHRFQCGDPTIEVKTDDVSREGVGMLRVQAIDSGKGVPEDIRNNIFEPFVMIKAGLGAGMGLTVPRESIRSLVGDIEVMLNPDGKATTSIMYHPIRAQHENLV